MVKTKHQGPDYFHRKKNTIKVVVDIANVEYVLGLPEAELIHYTTHLILPVLLSKIHPP